MISIGNVLVPFLSFHLQLTNSIIKFSSFSASLFEAGEDCRITTTTLLHHYKITTTTTGRIPVGFTGENL
jgi:hypothetical protein